jgi:hypothetical protein
MTASSLPALRAGADGLYAFEAATGLIIAHASWLAREDFARPRRPSPRCSGSSQAGSGMITRRHLSVSSLLPAPPSR